jgi:hypothetical protein
MAWAAMAGPVLFTIAALAAAFVIRRSLVEALPVIARLRAELAIENAGRPITMTTLDTRDHDVGEIEEPLRHRRHLQPKPVTHRLHHFRTAQAA